MLAENYMYRKEPFVVCPDKHVVNATIKYTSCIKIYKTHQFGGGSKGLLFQKII